MKICVLSSGSIGNATIIETQATSILIDNGLSLKKLQELIKTSDFDERKIEHIFVTHEHADHVKGVGICARKWDLKVWATEKTIAALYQKKILKPEVEKATIIEKNTYLEVEDLQIMPIRISHDAVDPVGYIIKHQEKTLVFLTDAGYLSNDIIEVTRNADVYILEANHNTEMLHTCNRPWPLKQRILSDVGHLSNEDSAYGLSQMIGEKTKHVFLAHISQDANMPDLALMTVESILKENDINLDHLNVHMTYPLSRSKVIKI